MRRRGRWLLALALCGMAGCYWQKYDKLVRTHVEVLEAMAGKMHDLVARNGRLEPSQMAEFRYPLERAQDFARIVRSRFGEKESFVLFVRTLDRYAALLDLAEGLPSDLRPAAEKAADIARAVAELREDGQRVLESLKRS